MTKMRRGGKHANAGLKPDPDNPDGYITLIQGRKVRVFEHVLGSKGEPPWTAIFANIPLPERKPTDWASGSDPKAAVVNLRQKLYRLRKERKPKMA